MGSWKETCAISNLPIAVWDNAYCLIIKKSIEYDDEWQPVGPPFIGKYNDSGTIDIEYDLTYSQNCLLTELKDFGIKGQLCEILSNLERGFCGKGAVTTYKFQSVLILEDIWNDLLKLYNEYIEKLFQSAQDWLNATVKELSEAKEIELFSLALSSAEKTNKEFHRKLDLLPEEEKDNIYLFHASIHTSMYSTNKQDLIGNFLAWDEPWPTIDVLRKLVEAADHLLDDHNCDQHGYEEIRIAANLARERLKIFNV